MKISGVNISGGIRMHQQATPAPSGPRKIGVGSNNANSFMGRAYVYNTDGTGEIILDKPAGVTEQFGTSIAMSDTKLVVGASATNGYSGKVYTYNLDGTGEQEITASDGPSSNHYFGYSVAVSDTKIVVGASGDGSFKGAAYIYNTDGTGELKITPSDGAAGDQFGTSVAMSDTKVVVGAPYDDDAGNSSGSVYVYNLDGTGEVKITASDAAIADAFGCSVAISDTHIAVGSQQDDDLGSKSGSVYVYNLDGTGEVKITPSDGAADDRFGWSVAMTDTHIVGGAINHNVLAGAVYIYNTDGSGEVKVTASDGASSDRFGWTVAITDTKVVVSASEDDSDKGAVYVYNIDGTGEVKITASDGVAGDRFGGSVAAN